MQQLAGCVHVAVRERCSLVGDLEFISQHFSCHGHFYLSRGLTPKWEVRSTFSVSVFYSYHFVPQSLPHCPQSRTLSTILQFIVYLTSPSLCLVFSHVFNQPSASG
jgi:hypothetical protein